MSRRSRIALLALLTIAAGLGTRAGVGGLIGVYGGDVLYAVLIYLCVLFVHASPSGRPIAAIALAICFAVEFSQLIEALEPLRAHRFAALVLGRGFLASDLACYALGVGLAAGARRLAVRPLAADKAATS